MTAPALPVHSPVRRRLFHVTLAAAGLLAIAALLVFLLVDQKAKPMQVLDNQAGAGFYHACAIDTSRDVLCWGDTPAGHSNYPIEIGVSGATRLWMGYDEGCAFVGVDVWCWGGGSGGQRDWDTPRPIASLVGAEQVDAGWGYVCGLFGDGQVACADRALGRSDSGSSFSLVPGVSGLVDFEMFSTGFGCGFDEEGSVWCWGNGSDPARMTQADDVVELSTGFGLAGSMCAVQRNGDLKCFGADDQPTADRHADVTGAVDVAVGFEGVCWVRDDGGVRCSMDETFYGGPGVREVGGIDNAVAVVAIEGESWCATERDGQLKCFGTDIGFGNFDISQRTWSDDYKSLGSVTLPASAPSQLPRNLAWLAGAMAVVSAIAWSRTRPHWVHRPRK